VALLTALAFAAAVNFYIDLSTASRGAIERVRGDRRAVALLDRALTPCLRSRGIARAKTRK
jgi:hypothetical protein